MGLEDRGFASTDAAFAEAIRDARTKAGMSQEDLATEMSLRSFDFHQQTVYKIESGKRKISIGEAVALADILGTPLALLTERNPDSIEARKLLIEIEANVLLDDLIELNELVSDCRNRLSDLKLKVKEFDEITGENHVEWRGVRTSAFTFFFELFAFNELDGLQWSWEQFRHSSGGRELLRSFGKIPASELPIEGYDDPEDE